MILKPVAAGRELEVHNTTVKDFARMIENMEFANRRPVADKTGLTGHYAFTLHYSSPGSAAPSKYPTLNSALEEALGLTLRQAKVAVELLVIDNLDPMPTPN